MFVAIIIITVVVQYIFVQFGGNFTQCSPLPAQLWLYSILFGATSIIFGFIIRLIPVGRSHGKMKAKNE